MGFQIELFRKLFMKNLLLSAALMLVFCCQLSAQVTYKGQVKDPEGEPLAFVTVFSEGATRQNALTDIQGFFKITFKGTAPDTLVFRYVGFAELRLGLRNQTPSQPLQVVMRPSAELAEVEVLAGENPADILIRKAVENRRRNNPEWSGAYRCNTYNKLSAEITPDVKLFRQQKKLDTEAIITFNKIQQSMQQRYLLMMESVTERSFKAPDLVQERVMLSRLSGFQESQVALLANQVQPFSFYQEYLTILDKNFVNPISPGSTNLYFFNIEDTLVNGIDTVWVISFKPRRGKVFVSLKGVLHLHQDGYAVQNVKAQPAVGNENFDVKIEQSYERIVVAEAKRQWFPHQLNFEIMLPNYPTEFLGLRMVGKSFITEAQLGADLRLGDFNPEQPMYIEANASNQDSLVWLPWRNMAPLTTREQNTYVWLDSIGEANKFDRFSKVLGALSTGTFPIIGNIGLSIPSLLRFNGYEQVRVGLGITNAQQRPLGLARKLEWGIEGGYGIRDRAFKYGGYGLWRIHRGYQTNLRLSWQDDLLEPGTSYELPGSSFFDRSLYAVRMDRAEELALVLSSRLWLGAIGSVGVRQQQLTPLYDYSYRSTETSPELSQFNITEFNASFRYAYGEQVRRFLGSDTGTNHRFPVLEAAYSRSLDGDFNYQRWVGALYQSRFIRRLGHLVWRVEGGYATTNAPMAKLFTMNQLGGAFSAFAVNQTFQTLPDTLILHNRFANLFVMQEIGPVLYQKKYSAPFLSLIANVGWGDLQSPEQHQRIGFESLGRSTYEFGLRLDHLIRLNYSNIGWFGLGGAVFYRIGPLTNTDKEWWRQLTPRLVTRFNL
jgi:Family of unknown function (DUF5686)/CarboxypepD_reg-like domain